MSTEFLHNDTPARLLALTTGSALAQARAARAKVALALQSCENLLFATASTALPPAIRLLLAGKQCDSAGLDLLASEYHARAAALGLPDDPRLNTLAQFVEALETHPARSNKEDLRALQNSGLDTPDIVLLAQSIGFVACQLRLLAGLQALRDAALDHTDTALRTDTPTIEEPFIHPANLPPPGQALDMAGFTSRTLDWQSWLPLPDATSLTDEQQAVLDLSHPKARESDFYRLLVHQPQVLQQRSLAFNAIMYAPGGLSRAEREIAATTVSRTNGCVYCTAVHALRFEQLARRNDVIAQIFTQPETAGTNARERALIAASLALTRSPATFTAQHILALHQAGLELREMLDWLHVTSLFAWANRLMLNLGQEVG